MLYSEPLDKLIFQYEILRAKSEVRNHYLKSIVSDIYENTGQMLSLIRVQLSMINEKVSPQTFSTLNDTDKMVSEVIRNLREMSRNFYPEVELSSGAGLQKAIDKEVNLQQTGYTGSEVQVTGSPFEMPAEYGLLVFYSALEIIALLKQQKDVMVAAEMCYTNTSFRLRFTYSGKEIVLNSAEKMKAPLPGNAGLAIEKRIALIGGRIERKKCETNTNSIDILVPRK